MKKICLFLALFFSINLSAEPFEGFGVSLCWWAKECGKWPQERLDSLVEWLVSPEGLNYRIFRYNIGGGDDPQWTHCTPHHFGARGGKGLRAEFEGFQDEKDGPFHWDRDEGQRRILLMIKKKRPDAIFEAFSNSAPWWMTVSGCNGGAEKATDDNLDPKHYEDFARYLVEVCKHYKETYGIEFRTLDPFNEPETNYWYRNGGQEGCHFDVKSQVKFLKVLSPILKESGLKTVISSADETSVNQAVKTFDDGGRGLMGNLRMARRLIEDMKTLKPAAWLDWQYVEVNFDQWSLVKCDREWKTYTRHKNYYVRQQFSRFILPGYECLSTEDDDYTTLMAQSPSGDSLVVVRITFKETKAAPVIPAGYVLSAAYRTSFREDAAPVALPEVAKGDAYVPFSIVTGIYERR